MSELRDRSPALVLSSLPITPLYQDEQSHRLCCGIDFKTKGDFNRHRRSHDTRTWAQCPYCDHRTPQRTNLDGHINKKHLFIKPHQCRWCSKQFADKSDRAKHHKRVHQQLTDTLDSNAGSASRTEEHSIVPVVPAANTLHGETHSDYVSYGDPVGGDASFAPTGTPVPSTSSIANVSSRALLEAPSYCHAPSMALDGTYQAAYPNFTAEAANYLGLTSNTGQSPPGPFVCPEPQSLSAPYTQHWEWTNESS